MLPHDRLPIWLNVQRRRELERLRALLTRYFASVAYESFPFRIIENPAAVSLRSEIEPRLDRCAAVIRATNRVPLMRLVPSERRGQLTQVDLFSVAFELDRHSLDRTQLFEVVDAAREVYRADTTRALLRTINPLYWLDMTLALVELLPFFALKKFGVDPGPAARSVLGVSLRVTVRLATLAGILLLLMTAAGVEGEVRSVAGDLLELLGHWLSPSRGTP